MTDEPTRLTKIREMVLGVLNAQSAVADSDNPALADTIIAHLRDAWLLETTELTTSEVRTLRDVRAALGTEETGSSLVAVARAAHRTEQEHADLVRRLQSALRTEMSSVEELEHAARTAHARGQTAAMAAETLRARLRAPEPTEYLVRVDGRWHVCRPGATADPTVVCSGCDGTGTQNELSTKPGSKVRHVTCPDCGGRTRVRIPDGQPWPVRLLWADREGAVVCFADQDHDARSLPDA